MPLGLLSLAANLQTYGYPVDIYKPTILLHEKKDFKLAAEDILKHKPGLIGFSSWCISYPALILLAREIKSLAPEISLVFGGPQASILAKKTLDHFPFIDFVLAGEADFSLPELLAEWTKPSPDFSVIPGLYYRTNKGEIINTSLNTSITNLDELPTPAYDLVPELKWMKLDVGRGCPFNCTYCATNEFFSKKYRVKSADRIISEMNQAYQDKGITSFSFSHDMFTLNRKFIFELCDKLIAIKEKSGIEFKWTCSARIDCVSKEMLYKMKDAGCMDIFFGIETGSQRMQEIIQKKLEVSEACKIADICRQAGMNMHASFIIGFPEESRKDFNDTLRTALILATKGALTQVSELTLLPGTRIYRDHHKRLKFDGQFSNFSRNYCGKEEMDLIKKHPEMFSSFYYLPVQTLSRQGLLHLRLIFNNSRHFRNTLFLLSGIIEKDIENEDLLSLFRRGFNRIKKENKVQDPIALHWIRILDQYTSANSEQMKHPFIKDILVYEGFSALLKDLYSHWQLIQHKTVKINRHDNFIIKPTPIWKVISTNFKLESILPSENHWDTNNKRYRKRRYTYLLVATSENKCKKIRINGRQEDLLNQLSELSFSDYVEQVKHIVNKTEALLWLKKLKRWGVVVFSKDKQ